MDNGLVFKDKDLVNSFLVDDYYIDSIKELVLPLHDMEEMNLDYEIERHSASYLDLYKNHYV